MSCMDAMYVGVLYQEYECMLLFLNRYYAAAYRGIDCYLFFWLEPSPTK
jgi:hypothetical protein